MKQFIVEVDEATGKIISEPVVYDPLAQPGVQIQQVQVPVWMPVSSYVKLGSFVGIAIILGLISVIVVKQQTARIIERFGKFKKVANPGLNFKIPFIDRIAGELDLKLQQLIIDVETKTKDNVFVNVPVAVQYYVLPDKISDAFYKLQNPVKQITSYVFDVVRAQVPKMNLDDVFERKEEIATSVKQDLVEIMSTFGYGIVTALVTDISPDEKVKDAMNEINAQQRLREAAKERGEAEKILVVKKAEAEAESKKLQGRGIADQRRAIIDGLKDSVESFKKSVDGASSDDVMSLVLLTQYFDTMKEIGAGGKSNTIFMSHSPSSLGDLKEQILSALSADKKQN